MNSKQAMEGKKSESYHVESMAGKSEMDDPPRVFKARRAPNIPVKGDNDESNPVHNGEVTADASDAKEHRKAARAKSVSKERAERAHKIEPPPRHSRKPNPKLRMLAADVETTSESEAQVQARFDKEVLHKKLRNRSRSSTSDESDGSTANEREYHYRKEKKSREVPQGKSAPGSHQMPLSLSNKLLERSKKSLMNKVIHEFEETAKQEALEKSSKTGINRHPPKRRQKRGKRKRGPPIDASVIITNKPVAPSPKTSRVTTASGYKTGGGGTTKEIPVTRIDESEQSYTKLNGVIAPNGPTDKLVDDDTNAKSSEARTSTTSNDETGSSPVKSDVKKPALQELGNDLHLLLEEHKQIRDRLQSCLESTQETKPAETTHRLKVEAPSISTQKVVEGANKHSISPRSSEDHENHRQPHSSIDPTARKSRSHGGHLKAAKENPNLLYRTDGRPRQENRKTGMSANQSKNYVTDPKNDLLHRFYVDTAVGHAMNSPTREIRPYVDGKRTVHEVFSQRKISSSSREDRFSSPNRSMATKQYRQRKSREISPTNIPGSNSEKESTGEPRPKTDSNSLPLSSKHLGRLNSTAYELATALDSPPGSDQNSKPSTNTSFFHAEGQSMKSYIERTVAESSVFKSLSWCPTWIYVVFYFVLWTFIVKLMDGIENNGPTKCTTSEEIRQWSCILGVTLMYGATEIYFEGKTVGQGIFCMFFMAVLVLISHSQPLSCRLLDSNLTLISYIQAGHNFLLALLIAIYRVYSLRRVKRRRKKILESIDTEGTVDSILKTEDEDSSLFTFKDIT